MQARKLAAQVAELRARPDDKRCFDCEQLGTTYYVPQFSTFVCTPCSGVHMQFGHRVKSVTLADYSAHEVEQMQQGGNQVAAYRWLARYTPGKDIAKPTDRNPQKIRTWIQTVFVDKRYYSADAPIPRRSTDSMGSAATAGGLGGGTGGGSGSGAASLSGSGSFSSSSFRRSSSAREGAAVPASPAARTSPVGVPTSPSISRQQQPLHSHSPPVHDVREILGDKAPVLQVVPQGTSTASTPAAATAPQQPPPAAVFDPFAAPTQPMGTPAMQPVPAAPAAAATRQQPASTGGFEPFQQPPQQHQPLQPAAAAVAASAPPPAPAAPAADTAGGWASFDDAPAFPAPAPAAQSASSGAPAAAPPAAAAAAAATPAASAAMSNGGWADFGGDAFSAGASAAAGPAAAAAVPAAATPTANSGRPSAGASAAPAAAAASAGGAVGTPRSGKPPAKELAPDLFADFAYGPPAAAMPYQQQAAMAGGMRPPMGPMMAMQQQQMSMAPGFGPPAAQHPQVPAHLAWQVQQQAALQWQYQQQVQQQAGAVPGYGVGSPRGAPAAWGTQPGFGAAPVSGFGHPGAMLPGPMANGAPGMYGTQQQVLPGSGPTSVGSGPPSGGASQWTLASATAGVTEQNAFADLVDLKAALPSSSSSSSAGPAVTPQPPQQLQHQLSFGQMQGRPPAMQAQYGVAPGMMQGQYGAGAMGQGPYGGVPAAAPGYGQMPGGMPAMQQQPAMQHLQQPYGGAVGAPGFGFTQQPQQWGMPQAAAAAGPASFGGAQPDDEGNPFA